MCFKIVSNDAAFSEGAGSVRRILSELTIVVTSHKSKTDLSVNASFEIYIISPSRRIGKVVLTSRSKRSERPWWFDSTLGGQITRCMVELVYTSG